MSTRETERDRGGSRGVRAGCYFLHVAVLLAVGLLFKMARLRSSPASRLHLVLGRVACRSLSLPYAVWLPPGYSPRRRWPFILFLHGFGERGEDGLSQTRGFGQFLQRYPERFPCVVVMPQLPRCWVRWEGEANELALKALKEAVSRYHGDPTRLYLTGCSMGGAGCWRMAAAHPDRFAAVMPLCGRTQLSTQVTRLRSMPIWIFHGSADRLVPVRFSREMVLALRAAGNTTVRYTEYRGAGHNCWDATYSDANVLQWLLGQRLPAS